VVFLPLKGVSGIDKEGMPFYDPEADTALFETLKKNLRTDIEVRELDYHINDRNLLKPWQMPCSS